MPTYEYACQSCAHEFEEFQSITAKALRKCPQCGKPKLKRLIGVGAGIIFKGSGFYETDYRSESYKQKAKAETESTKSAGETTAKSNAAAAKSDPTSAKTESKTKSEAPKTEPKAKTADKK